MAHGNSIPPPLHNNHQWWIEQAAVSLSSTNSPPPSTLHLVDFDGTLFRSPVPNPELWDEELVGNIISQCAWFQDVRTLSPPHVPAVPDNAWWCDSVIEECQATKPLPERHENGILTILLTGRRGITFTQRVKELLASYTSPGHDQMSFDAYLLREEDDIEQGRIFSSTMDYKCKVLSHLLQTFPTLQRIVIWDDRAKDLAVFQSFLAESRIPVDQCILHQVVHDDVDRLWIPKSLELELVEDLVKRFNHRRQAGDTYAWMRKHPIILEASVKYTAVILEKKSQKLLLERFQVPRRWSPKAHHMTIGLGKQADLVTQMGGLETQISLDAVAFGEIPGRVQAVLVQSPYSSKPLLSKNAQKHITLCIATGAKASESNNIQEWIPMDPITLMGRIQEVFITRIQPHRIPPSKPLPVSIGRLVQEYHPQLQGSAIGQAVAAVQAVMAKHGIENAESESERIRDIVSQYNVPNDHT